MSKLREAAMAVIDRWQSRYWTHDAIHTGILIANLLDAVNEDALAEMQALTESEYRENTLVRLSNTHQQLDAALGYELIGTINGTHGGRWVLTVEDKAAVWPDGTAVYVWRGQE